MLPITVPEKFRIIAHRGASGYAPENTYPAFVKAMETGAVEVELDVQLTTDGVVVICHDETLERYDHGPQGVEEMSWSELQALDMGSWFSPLYFGGAEMMTLTQLLADFGNYFTFHIELKGKSSGLAQATYDVVMAADRAEQCIFTSFSLAQLQRLRQLAPGCRQGWLVDDLDENVLAMGKELELFQLCPKADVVTPELVAKGHEVVQEIRAWGVNGSPTEVRDLIHKVIDAGCDGMTINWPDWVSRDVL